MCGVFGYIGDLPTNQWILAHRLLAALALASERRGTDASGYAALTSKGKLLWERQPGPAHDLFEGKRFGDLHCRNIQMVIGHTRFATNGTPALNGNNHPHLAGDWALVHNGFIPAHEDKAAAFGLPLQSQCDSELLVQALCRFGEHAGPDVCFSFGGKQSVLAINAKSRRMLAWTNGHMPLVAFRADGVPGLWWASTEEIAREALAAVGLTARFAEARLGIVYLAESQKGRTILKSY